MLEHYAACGVKCQWRRTEEEKAYVFVYCFVNLVNGKQYVGITSQILSERQRKHVLAANNGSKTHFHRAIRKYGMNSFELVLLEECSSRQELLAAEKRWIWLLATNQSCCGYNMTLGGDGVTGLKISSMTRQKMRESHLGHKHSEEHCRKISFRAKERYQRSDARQKTSDAIRNWWKLRKQTLCTSDVHVDTVAQ